MPLASGFLLGRNSDSTSVQQTQKNRIITQDCASNTVIWHASDRALPGHRHATSRSANKLVCGFCARQLSGPPILSSFSRNCTCEGIHTLHEKLASVLNLWATARSPEFSLPALRSRAIARAAAVHVSRIDYEHPLVASRACTKTSGP